VVKPIVRKLCFLLGLTVMTVVCFALWELLNAPMTARASEPTDTPEPEIVFVEKTVTETVTEYVNVPRLVEVEIPVVVEKQIVVDRPIIAQESAERWKGIIITSEEIEVLARLAWREARGEGLLGMRLVIEVVLNRVLSDKFPNTVFEVLYQPGQFAPSDGALELGDITPGEDQYEAVMLAITETPILEPDVVFFATTPLYGEIFLHVGGHYFTRYPEHW
jgi:Cell wall hydrolyses involved in spore germination